MLFASTEAQRTLLELSIFVTQSTWDAVQMMDLYWAKCTDTAVLTHNLKDSSDTVSKSQFNSLCTPHGQTFKDSFFPYTRSF